MIIRGILIVILVSILTAGAYMIRTQSQEIASLRGDIDTANQAVNSLRIQVQAIQAAYQVRDVLRQEADNVADKQMQALDKAGDDWADVYLPDSLLGVFGTTAPADSHTGNATRQSDTGNTGAGLDAQDK